MRSSSKRTRWKEKRAKAKKKRKNFVMKKEHILKTSWICDNSDSAPKNQVLKEINEFSKTQLFYEHKKMPEHNSDSYKSIVGMTIEDVGEVMQDNFIPEDKCEYEQLIRSAIRLFFIPESTHIVAVAIDKFNELNKHEMVRCIGEPIGGYAYDLTSDAYFLSCSESIDLGSIPISYKMGMSNSNWVEFVPLPDIMLERCMITAQKRLLNNFREKYKDERFVIQFLQSIDC